MSEPFNEVVDIRGGNWRRRYCLRRGHVLIVAMTHALTLQSVCLRCHAAGDIRGIVAAFTRQPTTPDPNDEPGARAEGESL